MPEGEYTFNDGNFRVSVVDQGSKFPYDPTGNAYIRPQ